VFYADVFILNVTLYVFDCAVDKTRPFQMAMLKLQKDLQAAKAENDSIQNMWLESQKENLKSKDEINRLQNDNMFLRTQLGITDTVKIKTANEIADAKNREFEQKMEASKLYSELRKLQPLVDQYRKKMLELEQQLTEARMKLQEEHVNAQVKFALLQAYHHHYCISLS
jgi:predicted  nucleic acid-binding Zn-ribbon protein